MRRLATAALTLSVAGAAGACGGQQNAASVDTGAAITCQVQKDTRVGIATGNATGVYFALGNVFAEQVDATGGKLKATAAETGASVQNIQQVMAGTYQVGFSQADAATEAVTGTGSFTNKQPIATLGRIYNNYTQVLVRKAAGIKSVADMRNKRVSTGSPKSGTELIANRLLNAAGLNPATDVKAEKLDLTKTVDGMKDGTIDALVWVGGLYTPGVTDLLTTSSDKVRFLDISGSLPALQKINSAYEEAPIPAATYKQPADIPTIVVPNDLVVRADLDPNVACVLTRTLFERKAQLVEANAAASDITLATARKTGPVPLQRGSAKALDDLGAPR
ncbi:TAXI family TRAP transporter solute-binding subunit [Actinoplanes sp. NPDC051343]|uniref:TAXI family TRAP transporter solute-binding subunit n=1 Tax=Actinoplanes sp. NPDC051343 TaxID=3363906 RepID=UPI003790B6C5